MGILNSSAMRRLWVFVLVALAAAAPLQPERQHFAELEGFETGAVVKVEEDTSKEIKVLDDYAEASLLSSFHAQDKGGNTQKPVTKVKHVAGAAKLVAEAALKAVAWKAHLASLPPLSQAPAAKKAFNAQKIAKVKKTVPVAAGGAAKKVMSDVVAKSHEAAADTAHVQQDMEKAVNELTHPSQQTLTAAEEKKRARAAAKELMIAKKEVNAEENVLTAALNEEKTLSKKTHERLGESHTPAAPVILSKSVEAAALKAAKWIEGNRLAAELQKLKVHKPTLGEANSDKQSAAWQSHTETTLNELRTKVKNMGAQIDKAGFEVNSWFDRKFKHSEALLGESKDSLQETENKIRQAATASIQEVEKHAEEAISAAVKANADQTPAVQKVAKKAEPAPLRTVKSTHVHTQKAHEKAEPAPKKKASTKPNPGFRHMTKTVQQVAGKIRQEGHKIQQQEDTLARATSG